MIGILNFLRFHFSFFEIQQNTFSFEVFFQIQFIKLPIKN